MSALAMVRLESRRLFVRPLAWVLGAQGPKTVRSSKMEDVIFAGTQNRAALGRAEVSLTIDNADGILPIEFAEVTITRTLFRNGDSEYAINGVPCRLLDVQELLSDSGVGRQQHVIIGQGQLDQILNARPEDRRAVIEEAAGVLKFRRRKEKAERRLESTEGNMLRLSDLLRLRLLHGLGLVLHDLLPFGLDGFGGFLDRVDLVDGIFPRQRFGLHRVRNGNRNRREVDLHRLLHRVVLRHRVDVAQQVGEGAMRGEYEKPCDQPQRRVAHRWLPRQGKFGRACHGVSPVPAGTLSMPTSATLR